MKLYSIVVIFLSLGWLCQEVNGIINISPGLRLRSSKASNELVKELPQSQYVGTVKFTVGRKQIEYAAAFGNIDTVVSCRVDQVDTAKICVRLYCKQINLVEDFGKYSFWKIIGLRNKPSEFFEGNFTKSACNINRVTTIHKFESILGTEYFCKHDCRQCDVVICDGKVAGILGKRETDGAIIVHKITEIATAAGYRIHENKNDIKVADKIHFMVKRHEPMTRSYSKKFVKKRNNINNLKSLNDRKYNGKGKGGAGVDKGGRVVKKKEISHDKHIKGETEIVAKQRKEIITEGEGEKHAKGENVTNPKTDESPESQTKNAVEEGVKVVEKEGGKAEAHFVENRDRKGEGQVKVSNQAVLGNTTEETTNMSSIEKKEKDEHVSTHTIAEQKEDKAKVRGEEVTNEEKTDNFKNKVFDKIGDTTASMDRGKTEINQKNVSNQVTEKYADGKKVGEEEHHQDRPQIKGANNTVNKTDTDEDKHQEKTEIGRERISNKVDAKYDGGKKGEEGDPHDRHQMKGVNDAAGNTEDSMSHNIKGIDQAKADMHQKKVSNHVKEKYPVGKKGAETDGLDHHERKRMKVVSKLKRKRRPTFRQLEIRKSRAGVAASSNMILSACFAVVLCVPNFD